MNQREQTMLLRLLDDMSKTQVATLQALRALADEAQQQPDEFSIPFKPFFRIGDVVRTLRTEGVTDVVIRMVSALPNLRYDDGQISAASLNRRITTGTNNVLLPGAGAMCQYRFSPITEFAAEMDNPPGTDQWRTATQRFRVLPWLNALGMTENERYRHEVMSQFWVYEDTDPRFNFYPLVAVAAHRVEVYLDFWGWKYDFIKTADMSSGERTNIEQQIQRGDFRVVRLNGRPQ